MGCPDTFPAKENGFHLPEVPVSPSRIQRITLNYTRSSSPQSTENTAACPVTEHLVLDRFSQTLQMSWERETGEKGVCRYTLKFEVGNFLDYLELEGVLADRYPLGPDGVEEPAAGKDLIFASEDTPVYLLTIDYQGNPQRCLSGCYDKEGLPDDFPRFMELVHIFLGELGLRELPLPQIYEKPHRHRGQLIYCSVAFENSLRTYYYTTQDDTLKEGDKVVVPAGKDNHPAIATITEIEYFSPEDVPFPLEKVKKILRRCPEDDHEKLGGD